MLPDGEPPLTCACAVFQEVELRAGRRRAQPESLDVGIPCDCAALRGLHCFDC
jgi:hypothetical protein